MTIDAAQTGSNFVFNGYPHDWTEGTGVFPAGGSIVIANPTLTGKVRDWLFIQNQSAGVVSVKFAATLADGSTLSTVTLLLASSGVAGTAGAAYESYYVTGAITVSGTAASQVLILEKLK